MRYTECNVRMAYHWFISNQLVIHSDDTSCWAAEKEMCDLDDAAYALLMETFRDTLRSQDVG